MSSDWLLASTSQLGLKKGDLPNLEASFDKTSSMVDKARTHLERTINGEPDVDVVAFGSMGRYEMTGASDFDFLVLSYGFDEVYGSSRAALKEADGLRKVLDAKKEIKPPGPTAMFGKMVSAVDFVEVIGLEDDTNRSHSRRILLLEESVSLFRPEKHEHLLRSMLTRYLEAKPRAMTHVPRFLLNDLARYWRTLTIDYEAKASTVSSPYSTRYLKLILSRKFTYASSVLPLFAVGLSADQGKLDPESELLERLVKIFGTPPAIRFANAAAELESLGVDVNVGACEVLRTIDQFNLCLGSDRWRKAIERESRKDDPKSQPKYTAGRQLGEQLQSGLESIFFADGLRELSQRYLVL